jgi:O-antigen/teichoic acid export membrane protein
MKGKSKILQDQSLWEKLIKKWFWLYFFSFLTAPAAYLIKLFVSNSISVADVWVLYSIVSLISLLNTYNDLWLSESLQYYLPRFLVKKQYNYAKTAIYLSLAAQIFTALIIACVLWFAAPWLAAHYFHSESAIIALKYFCFYFLWINLFQTLQSIFIAIQDTFSNQFIDFIRQRAIFWFTVLFFFTWRASIQWYSLNWIFGLLIWIIVAILLFHEKHSRELMQWKFEFYKPLAKEYVKYALWCFIWLEISVLFWNLVQQFVIIFLWAEAAWFYTNFVSLFWIVWIVVGPILYLIFPMVSEIIAKDDIWKLKLIYSFFYTYLTVAILLLQSFLIPLWKEVWFILFWTKFAFSGVLLSYWAFFTLFSVFTRFNFNVLAWMWKIKERVKFLWVALCVLLISLISMIYLWVYWWVLALWFWYVTLRFLSFRELYNENKFTVNWKLLINNVIICTIMWIVVWKFKDWIFIFDDLERYRNLWKLVLIALWMAWIFWLANIKQFLSLKNEILKLKK